MPIPDYQRLMRPVLQALDEESPLHVTAIRDRVADLLKLSAADMRETYPNGKLRLPGRVGWALTYLKQAGAVVAPSRAVYSITDRGQTLLAEELVDNSALEQFPEFVEFRSRGRERKNTGAQTVALDSATPEERLEIAYMEIRVRLVEELLERLRAMDPLRFEKVVLDVLVSMGYGGSLTDRASLTARSGDHGIDGIIKEDKLGLDVVVVQAKQWSGSVGEKEVREFAGALERHRSRKGVFITTAGFSSPARAYVTMIEKRIVLIDGDELAGLMIDHDVGVSVTDVVRLQRVDSDYFDAGLGE